MPGDFSKLPKWAQEFIGLQGSELRALRSQLAELRKTGTPGEAWATRSPYRDPVVVGAGADVIRLRPRQGRPDDAYVDVHVEDGKIILRSGNGIAVHPVSGNVLSVHPISAFDRETC